MRQKKNILQTPTPAMPKIHRTEYGLYEITVSYTLIDDSVKTKHIRGISPKEVMSNYEYYMTFKTALGKCIRFIKLQKITAKPDVFRTEYNQVKKIILPFLEQHQFKSINQTLITDFTKYLNKQKKYSKNNKQVLSDLFIKILFQY